ncbi:MAG: MBL fold metallo-hydrolase [Infirmifilum sp.]
MRKVSVQVNKGVFLETSSTRVAFDPLTLKGKKPDLILVSHAHRDHYSPSLLRKVSQTTPILMSTASKRIIDPHGTLRNVREINPGETAEFNGIRVEAFHAGHILGSLQFRLEIAGIRVVYTGDFNMEKRVILEPGKPVKGDILFIDATYGLPIYVFPSRKELYSKLLSLIKEDDGEVVLKARKLGVAQEVTALISMATRLPVLVEPEIAIYNQVFEEFGEFLGRYAISDTPTPGAPLVARLSRKFPRKIRTISLTGWATRGGLPLSSHGDFKQLVDYVRESNPQVVVPVCGFRKDFAAYVSGELGFQAVYSDEFILNM